MKVGVNGGMRVSIRSCLLVAGTALVTLILSSSLRAVVSTYPGWRNPGVLIHSPREPSGNPGTNPPGSGGPHEPHMVQVHREKDLNRVVPIDNTEALRLKKDVRVLVWVMTSPKSLERARVVKSTWGQHADKDLLLFMSSAKEPSLPTVALNVTEGRDHLTSKTMKAFDYIYRHHFHKAEFFMKAKETTTSALIEVDDDTFVVMENLRYYLSHLDPDEPFVTGRHFRHHVKQGFPSGGAGYVISKETLARMAIRSRDPPLCKEDGPAEDVEVGRCLEKLGVHILNSTDSRGRSRFHPYTPMHHVVKGLGKNYQYWDANIVRVDDITVHCVQGPNAIHEFPITFHYVHPDDMKMLHYFVYNISPYGVNYNFTAT